MFYNGHILDFKTCFVICIMEKLHHLPAGLYGLKSALAGDEHKEEIGKCMPLCHIDEISFREEHAFSLSTIFFLQCLALVQCSVLLTGIYSLAPKPLPPPCWHYFTHSCTCTPCIPMKKMRLPIVFCLVLG